MHIFYYFSWKTLEMCFSTFPTLRFSVTGSVSIAYNFGLSECSRVKNAYFFLFQLENSGDVFFNFSNPQILSYWECLYFLIVTMSTVGYGDINVMTVSGRLFIVIFICVSIVSINSHLPYLFKYESKSFVNYL